MSVLMVGPTALHFKESTVAPSGNENLTEAQSFVKYRTEDLTSY